MPYTSTRRRTRRRRSNRVKQTVTRRLRRLWEHLPRGVAESAGLGLLFLAGMVMMWLGRPNNQIPGAGVCTLAVTALLWQAWKWRLRVLDLQRRRQKVEIRSRRRSERKARGAEEQEKRQRQAASDMAAHEGAREAEATRRQEELEQAAADERRRRRREEAIASDTARLLAMDEAGLLRAAVEAFEARGFVVASAAGDAECDILLKDPEGGLAAVARQAPCSRKAEALDIQALEEWRRQEGAATAYFIGVAGFAPSVIRLASTLPVMLVEPHLLAQWRAGDEAGSIR